MQCSRAALYTLLGVLRSCSSLLLMDTVHSQFHMPARRKQTSRAPADVQVTRPCQVTGASPTQSLRSARFLRMLQLVVPTWAAACVSFQHSAAMAQSSSARITSTRIRESAVE